MERDFSRRLDDLQNEVAELRNSVAISSLSAEKRIAKLIVLWAITIYIVMTAFLFAALAHGFHWI